MAGQDRNWGSRSVDIFEKTEQVGEGTYGQVYKAKNKETGEVVALKRVRMDNEKEGFPITAIREIKILKVLNHKNIVRLKEIVTSKGSDYNQGKGSIYMVMEFCDHDLTGLTDAGQKFTVPQIKCYMKQLLEGLAYCHAQKVLHRDIKGSNLLISNDGQLKLADFGLARAYDNEKPKVYTNRVITLWYRPPELLLGATAYGPPIDMWSAGCIFAELLVRKPILPGKNEFEQIDLIFKLLGTPDEQAWPRCKDFQYYDLIMSQTPRKYQNRFEEKFGSLEPMAKDLLRKLLMMDPENRITADDALDHEYFWSDPVPATPAELPKYPPSHEFTAKKRRQSQQQQPQQQSQQQQPPQQQQQGPGPQQQQLQQPTAGYPQNGYNAQPYGQHYQGYPQHYQQQQRCPPQGAYPVQAPGGYHHPNGMGSAPPAKRHRDSGFFEGNSSGGPPAGGSVTLLLASNAGRAPLWVSAMRVALMPPWAHPSLTSPIAHLAAILLAGRTTPSTGAMLGARTTARRRHTARPDPLLPRPLELLAPAAIRITTGRGCARRLWRRPTCVRGLRELVHTWQSACGRHVWERRVCTPLVTGLVNGRGAVPRKRHCMGMQAVLGSAHAGMRRALFRTSTQRRLSRR
uniref:Protein kinase domain-containing protein n=1 Tax=Haptolina brevifila TaxID=156173 RepID=A0A7S2CHM1_9EUKA|mmetsp:Transcript_2484/g.5132  ORF Transcript_2484/g.5132 Transcript_2484/m.5132 type:complete len:628 (+) Transcript_2484:151-2034(+)